MSGMRIAERIVMVVLLVALLGAAVYVVFFIKQHNQEIRAAVERGDFEIRLRPKVGEYSILN